MKSFSFVKRLLGFTFIVKGLITINDPWLMNQDRLVGNRLEGVWQAKNPILHKN